MCYEIHYSKVQTFNLHLNSHHLHWIFGMIQLFEQNRTEVLLMRCPTQCLYYAQAVFDQPPHILQPSACYFVLIIRLAHCVKYPQPFFEKVFNGINNSRGSLNAHKSSLFWVIRQISLISCQFRFCAAFIEADIC